MKLNLKSALLTGSAIVAIAALAPAAHAADHLLTNNAVWGTLGGGMIDTPAITDTVTMTTHNLRFDATEAGVLTSGAITATTGDLTIDSTGNTGNVSFTIGSFTGSSTADITVDNLDASTTRNVAVGFTNAVSTGGNLVVRNTETGGNNSTVTMTVGGNLTISGAGTTNVSVTGTGVTGTTALLDLNGANNTFAGQVTVTGGANNNTNDASLNIFGNATFTTGLALTNGTGQAILNIDGTTTAQSITGPITGNGEINVTNHSTSGVTFSGNSTHTGTLLVNSTGNNQAVRFNGNVASAITLGDNAGANTVAATFGATGNQTIGGTITGGGSDISNLTFTGGGTKTLGGAVTAIDNTTINGSTTVTTGSNFASTNTAIASGSTFISTGNAITSAVANSGTLRLNGATGITGAITGTGLLDVDQAATFNGAVTQGTADIAAVTLTQDTTAGGWNVGTTNFSGNGGLSLLSGGQTIAGDFANTTAGHGTITVANGAGITAFTGNLGESATDRLAALTFQNAGGNAQTVTLTRNLYVVATTLDAADTLSFIGTSAQTVAGTIAGHGDGEGILNVGTGTSATDVTFTGIIGNNDANSLASATVAAGATARFTANADFDGAYTNTGTTRVSQGAVVTSDEFSNTGTYYLGVTDANGVLAQADFGQILDSGDNGVITHSRVNLVVTGDVGLNGGAAVQMLTGVNLGAGALADNSIQYTFTTANAGANTNVVVTRATSASLAQNQNGGVAATMDGLSAASLNGTANAEIRQFADNLATAPTQEQFNEVLESAGPTIDGSAVVGGYNASVQSINVNNARLASLNNGETGMVAGELSNGLAVWTQGFGQTADQDRRDGVDGYEADTYGVAVGIDTANLLEHGTVGVALSYANTDADSKNANSTNTDIDSYQVSLYGDYDVAPNTYISGTLAYAYNDIDQTRHNVGGTGLNAQADYDSNQYIAYGEVGHTIEFHQNTFFTPYALAHYQHISIDDYLESGAGGLNLNVDNDNLNIFELGVGAEIAWELEGNGTKFRPALDVGYRHDLINDDVSSTSTFTGGGASFDTDGLEPSSGTFNVGASLGYAVGADWDFKADYNYEIKSDYDAHAATLRATYKY